MTPLDSMAIDGLLQQARNLSPVLQDMMHQTFQGQSHYTWASLDTTQQAASGLCHSTTQQFRQLMLILQQRPDIYNEIRDPDAFMKEVRILRDDLAIYSQRLLEIHSKHQGKTGVVHGGPQVAVFMSVWEEYINWIQSFTDVPLNTFGTIHQDVTVAISRLSETQA